MCFTVGSPDHAALELARLPSLIHALGLIAVLVFIAPKPHRFMFHLWAFVSPMENYSES
jgi:hypothetical protein